jgi:hypothetical protein
VSRDGGRTCLVPVNSELGSTNQAVRGARRSAQLSAKGDSRHVVLKRVDYGTEHLGNSPLP